MLQFYVTGGVMKTSSLKLNTQKSITLDTVRVTEEILSAEEFLDLAKTNPGIIRSSRIVMPQQGKSSFGSFSVQYMYPRFKTA